MRVDVKPKSFGCFKTPEAAGRAYDRAAVQRWGLEAVTNVNLGLLPPEGAESESAERQ